eukprot:COSAG01_NODE_69_length_28801_cov_10.460038_5_plen_212_part_00
MQCLINETTFKDPHQDVGYDETLLNQAKLDQFTLRLWEPSSNFVVLGRSNKAEEEVYVQRCLQDGIPIIQRCSGGGTVFQSKGMLNYAIIGPIKAPFDSIQASNQGIMSLVRTALSVEGIDLAVQGYTDLTYQGKKCCGNAQKRSRSHFLFHGTIMLAADIKQVACYLKHPTREPSYRDRLSHEDFLCNLPLSQDRVVAQLKQFIQAGLAY